MILFLIVERFLFDCLGITSSRVLRNTAISPSHWLFPDGYFMADGHPANKGMAEEKICFIWVEAGLCGASSAYRKSVS